MVVVESIVVVVVLADDGDGDSGSVFLSRGCIDWVYRLFGIFGCIFSLKVVVVMSSKESVVAVFGEDADESFQ